MIFSNQAQNVIGLELFLIFNFNLFFFIFQIQGKKIEKVLFFFQVTFVVHPTAYNFTKLQCSGKSTCNQKKTEQ